MNLYTWHMSHATYRFLLFALTWNLITTNGQSIPRDTRTVFSLPLVIVSLRIEHWCFIFRWTCSPNVNTKQMLGQVWQCHVYVALKQLSEATMEPAVEKAGDACGLHVESLTRNESTCACVPGQELLSHDEHARTEVKRMCECPEAFLFF